MSDRIFVATRKGVFTLARARGRARPRWRVVRAQFLGDNASMVLPDPRDGWVYVALGHGHFGVKLHRSANGGRTWEPCATPAYPPKPADLDERDPNWNRPIPWNTELVWALVPGHTSEPGVVWCGTQPGGVFRSTDRGGSWQLMDALWRHPRRPEWTGGGAEIPGAHSICVHPDDPRRVAVGVSCGGVWATTDGGRHWDLRADGMRAAYMPPERTYDPIAQDVHSVVQCPVAPDVFWAQHHNGIFRSTDGCASWTEVSGKPSSFGFAVAATRTIRTPRGSCRGSRTSIASPRRGRWSCRGHGTAAGRSRCCAGGCPRRTPTTSRSATRSTSTGPESGSRSGRRPARCSSRRTAATRGKRRASICRRCTASDGDEG